MLEMVAWTSLVVAFLCAAVIVIDEIRRPQQMAVMNIVWPVTALYLSILAYGHTCASVLAWQRVPSLRMTAVTIMKVRQRLCNRPLPRVTAGRGA